MPSGPPQQGSPGTRNSRASYDRFVGVKSGSDSRTLLEEAQDQGVFEAPGVEAQRAPATLVDDATAPVDEVEPLGKGGVGLRRPVIEAIEKDRNQPQLPLAELPGGALPLA